MDRYMDFCRSNKITTAFLWTDMDCNYSFYQKYGFKLHNTFQSSNLSHNNKHKETADGMIFLYRCERTTF